MQPVAQRLVDPYEDACREADPWVNPDGTVRKKAKPGRRKLVDVYCAACRRSPLAFVYDTPQDGPLYQWKRHAADAHDLAMSRKQEHEREGEALAVAEPRYHLNVLLEWPKEKRTMWQGEPPVARLVCSEHGELDVDEGQLIDLAAAAKTEQKKRRLVCRQL